MIRRGGPRELQGAEADCLAVARRRGGEWGDRNHPIAEAVNAQNAPHGWRQTVTAGNGRLINYSIARLMCA